MPLGLVGAEQRGVRVAGDDGRQLPAQVGRVLEPGVHALAAGRGVHVRGVAGQEHPPDLVGGRLPFVAVEAGHPAGVVHPEVPAEGEAGDLLNLGQVQRRVVCDVTAAVPADHPVVAVAERREEGEGVADGVDGEQGRRLLGEPDVGEDDRPDHRPARERQPDRVPYAAAHAVGADDVRRTQALRTPLRTAHLDGHPVGVLGEPGQLGLVPEAGTRRDRAPLQDLLDLVLGEDEEMPEAGGEDAEVDGEAAEQTEAVQRLSHGLQVVGETTRVELFEGAGVQDEGAGEVADLPGALFEDGHRDAGGGEITGEQQAGGAGADDDDVLRAVSLGAGHGGLLGANICWPTGVGQRLLASVERWTRPSQRLLAYAC